jgi:hypothetical protein
MGPGCQLRVPAALSTEEEQHVHIKWAPVLVWIFWRRDKACLCQESNPGLSISCLVNVVTESSKMFDKRTDYFFLPSDIETVLALTSWIKATRGIIVCFISFMNIQQALAISLDT